MCVVRWIDESFSAIDGINKNNSPFTTRFTGTNFLRTFCSRMCTIKRTKGRTLSNDWLELAPLGHQILFVLHVKHEQNHAQACFVHVNDT